MNFPATVGSLENLALPDRPLHLAIGMFDGVHRGHQSVIQTAISAARKDDGVAGVLTFWPHPSALFRPARPVPQIMTPAVKAQVLRSLGVDLIIQQPFTPAFASIPSEDLVGYLRQNLPHLTSIYVGENWRFGKGRKGDVALLTELGRAQGVQVISAPRLTHAGEAISSTRIRNLLAEGQVELANALFGYNYFSEGVVQAGKQLGRTLGFPTLNLPWNPSLRPRFGVYAVRAGVPGDAADKLLRGVANYGVRPTVETSEAKEPLLEVFLLNENSPFSEGDPVRVEWLKFLRSEKRFADVEELKAQIVRDVESARSFFSQPQ